MKKAHEKVRFGVFGTGWMADVFTRELIRCDETEVVGVASPSLERAQAFAAQYDIPLASSSYDALAGDERVDVVYVATTNDRHYHNAITGIDHGKAVLVEKPVTMDIASLEDIIARASARRVFLMEAMWMRCFPFYRELERRIAAIGKVRRLEASFKIDIPFDPSHRLYNPKLGGGALFDIGIYPLHLAHRLFGFEGAAISSDLGFADTGADDRGRLTFTYDDGRVAILEYGLQGLEPHVAVIEGEQGRIVLNDFFHPSAITTEVTGAPAVVEHLTYPVMGYHFEIEHVAACYRAGRLESDLVPFRVSLEVTEMMLRLLGRLPEQRGDNPENR